MSSIGALNSGDWLTQTTALQGSGPGSGTDPAMDAFAALFAQTLALQVQAPNAATATAGQGTTSTTSATQATSATSGSSSVSSDLAALGQALSSNNLAAAQQAFQSLQTDLQGTQQTQHHHHHHHHGSGSVQGAQEDASTQDSASTQTSTSGQTGGSLLETALSQAAAGAIPGLGLLLKAI
jgi:hypothetical protein